MMVHCVPMSGFIESRKLYSTLRVSLLEKDGGEAAEALYDYAACYEQDIAKAMDEFRTEKFPTNDLMRYFSLPHKQLETAIRSKVLSAHPTVHAEGKSPLRCFGAYHDQGSDGGGTQGFCGTNRLPIQYRLGRTAGILRYQGPER